jgi:streptogramin lyase
MASTLSGGRGSARAIGRAVAVLTIASLAACGIPDRQALPSIVGASDASPHANASKKATVSLRIVIPRRRRRPGAHFISPATRSLAITTVSSKGVTTSHNVDLTPATNPGCTPTGCSISFSSPTGSYTYALAAYDGLLGANGNPTGNRLSADLSIPVSIRTGRLNTIGVTLDGIPASVALVPSPSSELTGSALSYQLSKCYSHTAKQQAQSVTIFGIDADHNYILGAGAPASTLVSDDSVHLAVSSASPTSPTTYLLSDPTGVLPSARSAVHLSAKLTPAAVSGGTSVSAVFTVAFDASICGVFTEFPVPADGSAPIAITDGPDGALWFTEGDANKIGRITTSGAITEFSTSGTPYAIAAGPDSTIWFTQCGSNQVGQIATTGGTVYESHVPTGSSGLLNMTADPHGGFPWFTETLGNNVDTLRESGFGFPTVRETAVTTSASRPWGITGGPDGAMWFTEECGNNIGRLASGVITEFPIPTSKSSPEQIASGPDGNLWFTEGLVGKIGRITTAGTITEFPLPAVTSLEGIAAGPDGAMYFTDNGRGEIGRITTTGSIYEFPLEYGSLPNIITQGPDGNMWFTEETNKQIVRMQ